MQARVTKLNRNMFCDVRWSRSNRHPTPAPHLCVCRSYCDQHAPSSRKENINGECCSEHSTSHCCLADSRPSFSRQVTSPQPGCPRTTVAPTPTQASARSHLGYMIHSHSEGSERISDYLFFKPLIFISFLTETPELHWQVSVKICMLKFWGCT